MKEIKITMGNVYDILDTDGRAVAIGKCYESGIVHIFRESDGKPLGRLSVEDFIERTRARGFSIKRATTA